MMNVKVARKSAPLTAPILTRAIHDGLLAAGYVVSNEVKRSLRGGYYTSARPAPASRSGRTRWIPGNHGNFVTGNSLNHVMIGAPVMTPEFSYIRVFTDLLYNLFWEIGHHNLFTRRYERDERWAPAFRRAKPRARAAFDRVFLKTLRTYGMDTRGTAGVS